jgi:hypothetical protein
VNNFSESEERQALRIDVQPGAQVAAGEVLAVVEAVVEEGALRPSRNLAREEEDAT